MGNQVVTLLERVFPAVNTIEQRHVDGQRQGGKHTGKVKMGNDANTSLHIPEDA